MCSVQCQLDVLGRAAGNLAEGFAVDRRDILEVLAPDRRDAFATDPVVVPVLVGNDRLGRAGGAYTVIVSSCEVGWSPMARAI